MSTKPEEASFKVHGSTPFSALNDKWKSNSEKESEQPQYLLKDSKEAILSRLRKIEGQIRALKKMVQLNKAPEAIVQQIASISGALSGLSGEFIYDYFKDDFLENFEATDDKDEAVTRIRFLIRKLIRS